ncbi:hypothetical protein P12x_002222 [Tundrisphaera lichenicola]|uniref:hypothetical protein n=1 Tax=Tundrisphaera lichenicola TaxID=2029860 RepID=UPI003EB8EB46
MGDGQAEDRGRRCPNPERNWPVFRLCFQDLRLASGLAEMLVLDGWRVGWSRMPDGSWESRVRSPSIAVPVIARGGSRVSAISRAYLEAIRRSGLDAWAGHDRPD